MIFSKDKLFKLKKALLSLSSTNTEEGVVLITDGDVLEVGVEVYVDGEEGLTPAPDKIYTSNNQLIEVEGGLIKSITEKEVEQPVEVVEEVVEETAEEEVIEEVVEPTEEVVEEVVEPVEPVVVDTIEEEIGSLKSIIDEQNKIIEDLNKQLEDLKKQLEEPLAQPAEEEFKKQQPTNTNKIDFSKYIKNRK